MSSPTDDETPPVTDDAPAAAEEAPAADSGAAASLGIADALKRSLAEYLDENEIQPESGAALNLDWNFVRDHGGPLVNHMFQKLTKTFLPENFAFTVPTGTKEEAGEQEGQKVGVDVNFNLTDFLGKLFTPPKADAQDTEEE